jgi:hypothetical protein
MERDCRETHWAPVADFGGYVGKAITASSLIRQLQAIMSTQGDLPVLLRDPGTDWLLNVALSVNEAPADAASPQCIELIVRYDDNPYTRHGVEGDGAGEWIDGAASQSVARGTAPALHRESDED